jgi:hypothetical protein
MPSHWRHYKISEAWKPTGKFCGNSTLLEGFLIRRNSMFHSSFLGSGKCMEIGKYDQGNCQETASETDGLTIISCQKTLSVNFKCPYSFLILENIRKL